MLTSLPDHLDQMLTPLPDALSRAFFSMLSAVLDCRVVFVRTR
ncbi:hypothetical protein [Pararhodobacter marinus]